MKHMIHEEIEKGMPHILASPKEEGVVELWCRSHYLK